MVQASEKCPACDNQRRSSHGEKNRRQIYCCHGRGELEQRLSAGALAVILNSRDSKERKATANVGLRLVGLGDTIRIQAEK